MGAHRGAGEQWSLSHRLGVLGGERRRSPELALLEWRSHGAISNLVDVSRVKICLCVKSEREPEKFK
jgi:hypothetical protein